MNIHGNLIFNHIHPPQLHPAYCSDIDGLRAVAVLSVVIFHAFPQILPGGFTGVDVFFVISGFLISTILYSNLEAGRFSILEFYGRRIRRIFPALILVMSAIAQRQGIAYLSPRQYLCNESGCLAVLVTSETLSPVKTYSYTAFDLAHLTSKASRYLVGQFPSK